MKYTIYQMPVNEISRFYAFSGKDEVKKFGLSFPAPRAYYHPVYEGECRSIEPNILFEEHNRPDRPARTQIRSMSVSDVIEYDLGEEKLALFVDSYSFLAIRFDDSKTGEIECSCYTKDGYTYVKMRDGAQEFDLLSDHLFSGAKHFKDQNGVNTKLTAAQIYAAVHAISAERCAIKYNGKPKSYMEWSETGAPLDQYVDVGDEVDEAIVDNFLEMLPPALYNSHLMQMGEPNEHLPDDDGKYKATYMTFERIADKWYYRGYCFLGETANRHRFPTIYETIATLIM